MRKCTYTLAVLLFSLSIGALSWADINDGLVAYYPFNGNARDESGNGNDGTVHGATLVADRYGNTDSAYHFDGVNDYIYIQYDTSLVPANYTVVVWYRADSFKVGEIITKGIDIHYYQIQFKSPKTGTNTIEFWYEDQLDNDYYILSNVGYDVDKYFMAAMIFDDLSLSAYINGQLIEEKVFSVAPYDNGDGLYIGKGNHDYFHGVIDDVRIYNRALSEAEIQELYNVMQVGTILYRTSGDNEMPGRVDSPTDNALNFPYLQIPCAVYCGLLYYDGWPTTSESRRGLLEDCPEENRPFPPTRTGHVAIYIGKIDGEHKIIEAGGNYDEDSIYPQIEIAPLNSFVDEGKNQVFIGAKFPTGRDVHGHGLPKNWQANIVGLAKEHKNEGYDLDFNWQKGETGGDWICVGFAEKLYESCNLEPRVIGEQPLSFLEPYPYTNETEVYNGYDITRDGFYNSGDAGGLTNSYSYQYSLLPYYFRSCDEMCEDTIEFKAYTTYSNSKEFSQVRHPRNDEYDTNCGRNALIGRGNNSKHYIFWPYTQFKQDTLKSIRTTLDVGTTVININRGPSKDNPVSVSPLNTKQIELEIEVLSSGNKVSGLTSSNFLVSLEKNEDGRCVAVDFSYSDVTKKISFSSLNIPYANIDCGTYEIRVDYKDNDGNARSSYSQDNALVVSNAPGVITGSATSVTSTSATLNGTVNPNGEATTYYFEYGVDTSYGSTTSSSSAGSGTSSVAVEAAISGLISNTTYHYRLVATNSEGTSYGDDKTFNATILYVQVKANGQNGPIVVSPSTPVSIDISLDPGNRAGELADWWIAAKTPFAPPGDWYTYVYPTGWKPGINLCVQTPLFALSPFEVLNMTLPAGDYTFYFVIDDPDRVATGPWWGLGLVEVTVQ